MYGQTNSIADVQFESPSLVSDIPLLVFRCRKALTLLDSVTIFSHADTEG